MALQPECDAAIEDIVNESLVFEDGDYPVQIILDKLEQPESIKKKIRDEYHYIMKLLDFNNQGYDIFRRWYVDGRIFYHKRISVFWNFGKFRQINIAVHVGQLQSGT